VGFCGVFPGLDSVSVGLLGIFPGVFPGLLIITATQNWCFIFLFCDVAEDFEFIIEIWRLETRKTLSFAILTKKSAQTVKICHYSKRCPECHQQGILIFS
jgi:hypothetical protein